MLGQDGLTGSLPGKNAQGRWKPRRGGVQNVRGERKEQGKGAKPRKMEQRRDTHTSCNLITNFWPSVEDEKIA